jgi:hypothetical protein
MPRFSIKSMFVWVASFAASLAALQIAWRHDSILALLVSGTLLGAVTCAPIGFAFRGQSGMRRGIIWGALTGFLIVCASVAWAMWYLMFHFF